MLLNKLFIMLIFYTTLIISTLIAMSSHSWMIIWMMLEINLMSFIPIIMLKMNHNNFLFKYFIVQTIGSSVFLIGIVLLWMNNYDNVINTNFMNTMIIMSMIMKMGMIPFHWWYIEIMMNLSWMSFFLMSTWQKFIPLMIISYFNMNMIIHMTVIISSLMSALQGMHQMNIRKILTFSSINQTSWMTINSSMSIYLMMIYMMIYMMISFPIMYMFNLNNFSYIHEMYLLNNYHYLIKLFLSMNILSLAGLPPMLGFFMKFISIKFLIFNKLFFVSTILILSSLMTLFFYLRLIFSTMILNNTKTKTMLLNNMMKNYYNVNMLKLNNLMFTMTSMNLFIMIIISMFIFH
uniref:NADH-ubiquinone oxidoreductase chain 2 n=1 Tax=Trachelus tabidus TaxID=1001291 RepID=A0A1J0KEP8_9HYME|nr:NADH dehydrogenase subunit 2 [Trachelus tabidus]APC92674.1 NADH dehydrogenase subunit 2 [Trachelus tabidus]